MVANDLDPAGEPRPCSRTRSTEHKEVGACACCRMPLSSLERPNQALPPSRHSARPCPPSCPLSPLTVVESMKRNIEFNGGVAAQKVSTSVGDARLVCLNNMGLFDAVDLDPYGSPAKLLDSAVQVGALAARHSRLERTANSSTQLLEHTVDLSTQWVCGTQSCCRLACRCGARPASLALCALCPGGDADSGFPGPLAGGGGGRPAAGDSHRYGCAVRQQWGGLLQQVWLVPAAQVSGEGRRRIHSV